MADKRVTMKLYDTLEEALRHPPKKKSRAFRITDVSQGKDYYVWSSGYKDALYSLVSVLKVYKVKMLKGDSHAIDTKIKKIVAKTKTLTTEERRRLIEALKHENTNEDHQPVQGQVSGAGDQVLQP